MSGVRLGAWRSGPASTGCTVVAVGVATCAASRVCAQPPGQPALESPATQVPPARREIATEGRSGQLAEGLWLLTVIILSGLGLVLLTMLWGWRARRLARAPLPPVTRQDDLWFLKGTRKPANKDDSIPTSE